MTTRIQISADAQSAIRSFNQVRAELEKVGEAGKRFADIDFSKPELADIKDDLERMYGQFQSRIHLGGEGRDLLKRMRTLGYTEDAAPWDVGWQRVFGDPAALNRRMPGIGQYVLGGTQFDYTLAQRTPPPEPQRKDEDRAGHGLSLDAIPFSGLIKKGAALAGLGSIYAAVSGGVSSAQQNVTGTTDLYRRLRDLDTGFDDFYAQVKRVGEGLGVASNEAIRLSAAFTKTAAQTDGVAEQTTDAIGIARSFGMELEPTVQWLARMNRQGATGQRGSMSDRELLGMVAQTIAEGDMFANGEDVLRAIEGHVGRLSDTALRITAGSVENYASLRAAMYRSDYAGLRGPAGDNMLASIDNSIRGANGPDARSFMVARALQPLGLDVIEQEYLREAGAFTPINEALRGTALGDRFKRDDRTVFELVYAQAMKDSTTIAGGMSNPDMAAYKFAGGALGLNMHQMQALGDVLRQSGDGRSFAGFGQFLGDKGLSLDTLNPSVLRDMSAVYSARTMSDIDGLRERMLGPDSPLNESQRRRLIDAEGQAGFEGVRETLAMLLSESGRTRTQGDETRLAQEQFSRAFADVGDRLLTPLNLIKGSTGELVDKADAMISAIETLGNKLLGGEGSEYGVYERAAGTALQAITPPEGLDDPDNIPLQKLRESMAAKESGEEGVLNRAAKGLVNWLIPAAGAAEFGGAASGALTHTQRLLEQQIELLRPIAKQAEEQNRDGGKTPMAPSQPLGGLPTEPGAPAGDGDPAMGQSATDAAAQGMGGSLEALLGAVDKRYKLGGQGTVSAAIRSARSSGPVKGGSLANDPEWLRKLVAADREHGFPEGTLWSLMMQETGGRNLGYHFPVGEDGKRRGHHGSVSTAYGPFGILDSTAQRPGFGVDPLQDRSLDEQLRFAADYLQARAKSAGGLRQGLAGYGEGGAYASQVLNRIERMPEPPNTAGVPNPGDPQTAWQNSLAQLIQRGGAAQQHQLNLNVTVQQPGGGVIGNTQHDMLLTQARPHGVVDQGAVNAR